MSAVLTPWPAGWRVARTRVLALDRPRLVGVVNATPDSFSDGGAHDGMAALVAHALALIAAGADVIDVGGESTRPGAARVSGAGDCGAARAGGGPDLDRHHALGGRGGRARCGRDDRQ